jgi:hypothetical protein
MSAPRRSGGTGDSRRAQPPAGHGDHPGHPQNAQTPEVHN